MILMKKTEFESKNEIKTISRGMLSNKLIIWMMTLPFLMFILIFSYAPLCGWYMAFVRYIPGIPLFQNMFLGLRYFEMLFAPGSYMPEALRNTLGMSMFGILVSPVPIIFAILINEVGNMRFRRLFQTAASLPNFISFVITYSIFFTFLSVDNGVINSILQYMNIIERPLDILGNEKIVWWFQTGIVGMWKSMGWTAIIYIAAIISIDQELYNAAKVDGCGRFKQIWHITIPGIIPTYSVLLLLSIGNMLSGANFEQIYVFYNPLVAEKIMTVDYYTYKVGLQMSNLSIGTAVGMAKSIISIILLLAFNFISKKIFDRSII